MGKFKFDVAIGNPPYQEDTENNGRKKPIYNLFMEAAYSVVNKVELITPARFLFDAGQTPKAWNKSLLNSEHFKVVKYFSDASTVFPNTAIVGGVAITYHDKEASFDAIKIFTPYDELNSILHKVLKLGENDISDSVSPRGNYRLSNQFFEDYRDAKKILGAGTGNMIVSNIFERMPEAFTVDKPDEPSIRLLGRAGGKRSFRYVLKQYVLPNDYIDYYNVLISKSDGASGTIGNPVPARIISKVEIAGPDEGATDTFISIGRLKTREEAENLALYLKTKFARIMLGVKKATQDNSKSTWTCVPIQDFTNLSDIDWTRPVAQIDSQLFQKYKLNENEIAFIEKYVTNI